MAPTEDGNHTLVLIRHGESEWNRRNLFTGWHNPDLSEKGLIEALVAAQAEGRRPALRCRLHERAEAAPSALEIILEEIGQLDLPITYSEALNERHYGDLCGLNKDEARTRWGEQQVEVWRRSYDVPPPGGESLTTPPSA